jgi:hypothetical protein
MLIGSLRNRFAINVYRTSASGVFHRKGFGFAICGNDRASVSQFVAGIGHGRPNQAPIDVAINYAWAGPICRICADAAFPDRGAVIGAGPSVSGKRGARLERER